jgi:NADP-dependent aldehyde dehydrogenase
MVQHPVTKAVAFTGSFSGGKQMFDWAMQRKDPIPVFAEMGSLNPVFLLPGRLKENGEAIAEMMADSVLQSSGQFCTKPGLIIGIEGQELDAFTKTLTRRITNEAPSLLLHEGILQRYVDAVGKILLSDKTKIIGDNHKAELSGKAVPFFTMANAADWMKEDRMQHEVFGPFTLLIICRDHQELLHVAASLEGQLTATVHASDADQALLYSLSEHLTDKAGRIILNGVPTGVNVTWAMHHGGPFPATTDSRFTAVGPDAIKRFARPVSFQNWKNGWLPDELKNENPLKILRWVNGELNGHSI